MIYSSRDLIILVKFCLKMVSLSYIAVIMGQKIKSKLVL